MINKIFKYSFLGCFLLPFISIAQEQLKHEKKMYVSPDNKIYVHETMPIYLFMSTTPNVKDAQLMRSEKQAEHTNPMHLDGHGVHYIKHQDHEKEVEVKFEIYADAISPKTTHDFNGIKTSRKKGNYYGGGTDISLEATDEMSGVEDIYFSVNGEAFKKYNGKIPCKEDGKTYDIKYYSIDKVGNVESIKNINFTVDNKSPGTSYKIHGNQHNNSIISKKSRFSLAVEETGSGVAATYFSLDNSKDIVYKNGIYPAYLSEGEHTLTYYSIDNVGNKEEKKSFVFYIDKTAPMIVKEVLGDKFFQNGKEYQSGRSKVKLTAMDNKAGVKEILYSINGSEFQVYSEPFYLPKTKGGISIKAYAVDNVNNTGKNDNNKKFIQPSYVDLSGPNLKHSFHGTTYQSYGITYISDKTTIKLTGYDSETGLKEIQYKVNNQNTKSYTDKISFSTEGKQKVEYTGYDNVSNSNRKSFEVVVDKQGPSIQKTFSIESPDQLYPKQTQIYLSATDKQVGTKNIYYSLNGGPEKVYAAPIKGFQEGKSYQIKIRAVDQLQNEQTLEFQFQTKGNEL